MLKDIKEKLQILVEMDGGEFHSHLHKRIGKRATLILEDNLKEVVLLMPELIQRTYYHWERNDCPSEVKSIGGYVLSYLYVDQDLLSEKYFGLFGYLDDAYFVSKVYIEVIDSIRSNDQELDTIDLFLWNHANYLKRYVSGVIPEETRKIDEMIKQLRKGKTDLFDQTFSCVFTK